jgi:hypothetical protein
MGRKKLSQVEKLEKAIARLQKKLVLVRASGLDIAKVLPELKPEN